MNSDDKNSCWPQVNGNLVRVRFTSGCVLIAQHESLSLTRQDGDDLVAVWCNGTGIGQIDTEQADRLESILARVCTSGSLGT